MCSKRAFTGKVAQKAAAPARTRAVVVSCSKQGESAVQKVQTVAAAIAAAALLQASPVSAGVVLEQPQLKKVFQDDGAPAAPAPKKEIILPGQRSKAAPAVAEAKAAAPKKQEVSEQGNDLDPKSIALPASIALIAGGAFAWSKVDEDFEEFFTKASVKDSNQLGAGYEPDLKGSNGVVAKKKTVSSSKAGTKKVKAASKSAPTSPLASLFGSKDE
jgi:hypothetical protein